jgi:serine/threonine protein kinase/tetratricopeptide (TPR) repeat protein
MPPEERSVESILAAAVELTSPTERQQFVEQACGANTGLRSLVEELVKNHFRAGNFLEQPADRYGTRYDPNQMAAHDQRPTRTIGPYKLLERIGEGGFGVVYMAEQLEPVRRKVALKVLKPGMDTHQVIARFEAERQALALMDHPNIARIFDAGTTDEGRPYFVMELVKGMPITAFCDQRQLPVRERLELFITVCQAVQHAHQKGVIHRDIKPSNVLVTLHDDTPVAKVIDFGVAKATSGQLTDKTLWTGFAQMVGTPLYMSPEQAALSGLDVDTRSDVYALGVVLYELLTGATPFDRERLARAALDEVFRIIREEEPKRPSTRVSTLGQEQPTSCVNRKTEPRKLSLLLRGDLDWIVMKALEKDRTRRYETANGLARDVQRYLGNEVVEACPPSARYRLRKLARRYRAPLRFAAAFVALLVLAAAVGTWQAVRATLAGRQALAERDRAEASFRTARDAVDQLLSQLSESPELKAHGMEKFRKNLLKSAKGFYERFIREQFDVPSVRHELGLAHLQLAEIERELGDYAAAEESATQAVTLLRALADAQPDVPDYRRDLANGYVGLGLVYFDRARWEQAEAAYQQALAIQEKQAAAHPEISEYRYALAKTYRDSGFLHHRVMRPEIAAARYERAIEILNTLSPSASTPESLSLLAMTQVNLATVYATKGWFDKTEVAVKEAQRVYERLLHDQPDASPEYRQSLARSHAILGMAYRGQAQFEKAEAAQHRALDMFGKLAKEHPDVQDYAYDLGRCYVEFALTAHAAGRNDDALARYDQAIAVLDGVLRGGLRAARSTLLNARIDRTGAQAALGDHTQAAATAEAMTAQADLTSGHHYDLACTFAQCTTAADRDQKLSAADRDRLKAHYAEQAMDFLRRAVAEGWQNPQMLKTDPDVDPLRGRQDFRKLLAELEPKSNR